MADVQLTITIPDAHVARVSAALASIEGAELSYHVNELDPRLLVQQGSFNIQDQGAGTFGEYVGNIIVDMLKQFVYGHEDMVAEATYQADLAAVVRETPDIPSDLVT